MNRCDQPVTLQAGGTEPAYRAGLEISLDQPPAAAIEELLKACAGTIADQGYGWTIIAGAPALPVYAFTDDDVIVSRQQELDPFPGLQDTYNAVSAKFPDPVHLWETKEAPQRTNAALEASDAFGRRMASLSLPAAPFALQVQRLMRAWIEDERRFRRHVVSLPPDASHVELTETISWSSQRNGYEGKDFSTHEIVEDPRTGIRQFSLRERDPSDYGWQPSFELPTAPAPAPSPVIEAEQVSGFAATAAILTDGANNPRRPAIRMVWDGDIQARALKWEVRLASAAAVALRGDVLDIAAGETVIVEGILPETQYEVRARLVKGRPTEWTSWRSVLTANVRIGSGDIDTTPPVVVTGLALASSIGELIASWNPGTAPDIAYYDIELTEAGSNAVAFQTALPGYRWSPVLPNVAFSARVRAVDRRGNKGGWSAAVSHTTARDTTPPAVPTVLGSRPGFSSILLSWNDNTEADFSHYQIYESATATNPVAATAPTHRSPANTVSLTGYADGTTRHFWLRAVDTSGNASAWTARHEVKTASLTDTQDAAALPRHQHPPA